jgi:Flp pilus assembly protein TadG
MTMRNLATALVRLAGRSPLWMGREDCASRTQEPLLAALFRNRRGATIVEFAVILPMLMTAVAGLCDFGLAAYASIQVQQAVQLGAQYALEKGWDQNGIATAVVQSGSALGGSIVATPAPTKTCGCPSSSGVTAADCTSGTCGVDTVYTYVTVSAQLTYNTILPWPGVPNSYTFSAQSMVRIQ